jgi:DUF4097 and DUF4098 domain-containing protein YvlB
MRLAILIVVGVAFIGAGAACAVTGFPRANQTEQQSQTYHHTISAIEFNVDSGDLRLSTSDASDISVTRRLGWTHTRPSITEEWQGDTLRISTTCQESACYTDYTVTLPSNVRIKADTSAGDIRVMGASGAVTLHSGAGDISATSLGSPDVDATTNAGDITVRLTVVPATVSARSAAGDVEVSVPDAGPEGYRVQASTGAGDNRVAVTANAASTHTVVATSNAGDITVRYA